MNNIKNWISRMLDNVVFYNLFLISPSYDILKYNYKCINVLMQKLDYELEKIEN